MSLYEKHRPKSLADIVGNTYIVEGLSKHFGNAEHNHSFLFHGDSGCGKTTFGTIIANIVDSRKPDFVHVNGADFRGIEMARQVNEEAGVRPVVSKARLYMIDEFHMITKPAQNALLDVLERTPKYVYFVLCTTEPNSVINTIKNRCSRYRVVPLRTNEAFTLIKRVADKENIQLLDEVLKYIAIVSDGVPRTALNYLEQIRDVTDPEKALDQLEGLVSSEGDFKELLKYTISGKKDCDKALLSLKNLAMEPEQVRRGLLTYCTNKAYTSKTNDEVSYYVECIQVLRPELIAVNEALLITMLFKLTLID